MRPNFTIVLDCPIETGLARTRARVQGDVRGPDRFEGERIEFHRRVREGFLAIAREDPARVVVIDSTRPRAEVTAEIVRLVSERLARR